MLAQAGSSTLVEICAVGKPSLLVPSPNVTDHHQEANARGLETAGAARVMVEREINVGAVATDVATLLADHEALARMGEAARTLGGPSVAEEVATLLEGMGAGAG